MEQPLKLGVIGCGWAGRQAVWAASTLANVQVSAVADVASERSQAVGEEFSVPRIYRAAHDLIADPTLDAIYIATAPVGRLPIVLAALAAGKHTLVQKPHAVRADEILQMEAAAQTAGKVLQFCYFMRHLPANRRVRQAIAAGKIGEPYHARIFLKYNFLPPLQEGSQWLNIYGQKGGALGQHASHELDLAWWWLGCPEPEWAFAVKHSLYPVYNGPEGAAEDYLSGLVGLAGGKTMQIDCSRMVHVDTPRTVELYGKEGAISNGKLTRYVERTFVEEAIDESLPWPVTPPPDPCPHFFYEVEHFVRAIQGVVPVEVAPRDAYHFMRILDALYDSAATQRQVRLIEP